MKIFSEKVVAPGREEQKVKSQNVKNRRNLKTPTKKGSSSKMANFFSEKTFEVDNLIIGNAQNTRVENVNLKSEAEIQRGMILCGESGIYEPVQSAADKSKPLVIASETMSIAEGGEVGTVYTSGEFNLAKVMTGSESLAVDEFKDELRKVDILLSGTI